MNTWYAIIDQVKIMGKKRSRKRWNNAENGRRKSECEGRVKVRVKVKEDRAVESIS